MHENSDTNPIPFHLPDDGLTEIKGTVYLDPEFLVVVVETALMGEFQKEQQLIKIEPSALQHVRLERGLLRDRLCIRPKKRDFLQAMPGTYHVEVALKIWRKHRADAERLMEEIERRISEVA